MSRLTSDQKTKLIELESRKFKNHAQALKTLSTLENGADHPLAGMLLSQIEESLVNLRLAITGKGGAA